jgi:hypothetical protein
VANRGMNVWVNIGAKVAGSLGTSMTRVEQRFGQMGRKLKLIAAESKVAFKEAAAAIKPLAGMAAAGGLTLGVKKAIGSGAGFMHEISLLRISGRTATETALAIKQAHKTVGEVPTSTLTDNLKIIRETTGAYGDMKHALDNLSFNQRLGYSLSNVMGLDQTEAMHTLVAGIQALEIRGSAMDHHRYQKEMNALFQSSAFFAGKEGAFTTASLRDFAKTGNIPLKMMGERFMTRILPAIITEVGSGDIVGTQMTAFNNWLNGNTGTGNKSKTEFAKKIGLVDVTNPSNFTKTGWKPGAVIGTNMAKTDPFEWVEKILLPKLEKAGVNIKDTKSLEIGLSQLMTKETAKRFVMGLADPLQRKRLHKDEANINKAMSSEEGYSFMLANDPTAAWAKVMSSLENLTTNLGKHIFTDRFFNATDKFVSAIDRVSGFFDRNAAASNVAVGGMGIASFGLIATLLGGGGLIRLLGAGLGRLFASFTSIVGRALMGAIMRAGPYIMAGLRGLGSFFMSGFRAFGPFVGAGLRALGPFFMSGLRLIAPFLLGGLRIAFGILSGPVGWAILAATAIALIWKFRDQIATAWHFVVDWFKTSAWPAITATFSAVVDWGAGIVNNLISGLSSAWPRLKAWFATQWNGLVPQFMQVAAGSTMPVKAGPSQVKIAGARAKGGPMGGGKPYLVGEEGPELVIPRNPGTVLPAHATAAAMSGGSSAGGRGGRGGDTNIHVGKIIVQGAHDPNATAKAVRDEIRKLGRRQNALLTD